MTPQPQQEIHDQIGKLKTDLFKCIGTIESIQSKCRSRPAANMEKDVLDLLKKKIVWGKEIDRNHLFDYHAIEKMIEEAEQRAESLRSTDAQQHRSERR